MREKQGETTDPGGLSSVKFVWKMDKKEYILILIRYLFYPISVI
jgi:hypothetical protein